MMRNASVERLKSPSVLFESVNTRMGNGQDGASAAAIPACEQVVWDIIGFSMAGENPCHYQVTHVCHFGMRPN